MNVARHAQAVDAEVALTANGSELVLEVVDDGMGVGNAERRSGLANLRVRAERHGGSLVLGSAPPRKSAPTRVGTSLRWTIPLV